MLNHCVGRQLEQDALRDERRPGTRVGQRGLQPAGGGVKAVLPCLPLPLAPALAAATRVLSHPDVGEVGAVRREAHRTGGVGDVLCGEGGRVGGVSAG